MARTEQEGTAGTPKKGRVVRTHDWVITFSFDLDLRDDELDRWADHLDSIDASVARVPNVRIDVTVYADGHYRC